ncbi:HET-domain-containing protein [Apiospora kogelbergensis]|uniref:HET-domain-containing protein n=1 Tax=Apiospora kogelbergensis TaxID=1337665 RepID=UPI00312E402B
MPIDFSEVEFRSLVALLCRPWFTRLWIRQETFLANSHAIICCGDLRVFWTAFRNALALFHRKSKKSENPGPEKAAFCAAIRRMVGVIYQPREIRLDDLRTYLHAAGCGYQRNHVFVVKGMLQDGRPGTLGSRLTTPKCTRKSTRPR